MFRVLGDELLFIGRNLIYDEDGVGRADRHTGTAIDAAFRVNIQLGGCFESVLILLRVDTVGRTSFYAEFITPATAR